MLSPSPITHSALSAVLLLISAILSSILQPLSGQSSGPAEPQSLTREGSLYRSVGPGVFRIESGLSHGSGFLIDSEGLIATNDHVVGNGQDITVYVDSVTRMEASVVARDANADLALIRISPSAVSGRPALALASPPVELAPGDRVLALGYPLSQPLTMTAGMVANVREGALLTDATVNPGNSGGPILSLSGMVVAVTTFREIDRSSIGPGLSGAVLIDRLQELRRGVESKTGTKPSDRKLPVFPSAIYPISILKGVADTIDPLLFESAATFIVGPFAITVSTPVSRMLSDLTLVRSIGRDRRKRELRAGVEEQHRYADLGVIRDWKAYVGDESAPVVAMKIEPLFGETGGSSFRRGFLTALVGFGGQATVRFQGDVKKVTLFRNGKEIEPLRGGHAPVPVALENSLVEFSDVADFGYYVFPPQVFQPDSPQRPPEIFIEIEDLKNPAVIRRERFPAVVVARIWNDFEAYFQHLAPRITFQRYAMQKTCAADNQAAAMLGPSNAAVSVNKNACSYIVAPASVTH